MPSPSLSRSHASPTPSLSRSACVGLATDGQLSAWSTKPSLSLSSSEQPSDSMSLSSVEIHPTGPFGQRSYSSKIPSSSSSKSSVKSLHPSPSWSETLLAAQPMSPEGQSSSSFRTLSPSMSSSHASPKASLSKFAWSLFASLGQLSIPSKTPSRSRSVSYNHNPMSYC